jgi:hypothetical protein
MSREMKDLAPEFRKLVQELLSACRASGYPMQPFYTLRTPFEQGKLWRQSRTRLEITRKIRELRNNDAEFLAYCIESVGPQNGRHVTNAIPGLSWHQWGEAVDCFWLLDDKAEWSTRKRISGINGYVNYGTIARSLGLTSGGFWRSLRDWTHVQLRKDSNPGKIYSLREIDREMINRFSSDQAA